MTDLTNQFKYMAMATFIAYRALKNGETPVACIFVKSDTEILSFGCNDTNRSLNGTKHAEFVALRKIFESYKLTACSDAQVRNFFRDVVLYVTVEPCVMCALAMAQVGLSLAYFGAANDRFGGNGTVIKIQTPFEYPSLGGLMRVEAIHLLRTFYIQENNTAPVPKSKKNKEIQGKLFPPNLRYSNYVTVDVFEKHYGKGRTKVFYDHPEANIELTPVMDAGYSISLLLNSHDLLLIPGISDLYPNSKMTIEQDLEHLTNILPSVMDNGNVFLESNVKRRKLLDFEVNTNMVQ